MSISSFAPGESGGVADTNYVGTVYLYGDEDTDGSLRIVPDLDKGTEFEFQRRQDGVWNDTGIVIAASTVYLGRELQISGGGEWVLTRDDSSSLRSFLPHVRFDLVEGTDQTVAVPSTGAISAGVILQPDDSGEISSSTIQFIGLSTSTVLANALILKTGAAATGAVKVKMHRDTFDGAGLFYERNYPASSFPTDSEVLLSTDGLVELRAGEPFFVTLTCEGTLTLKADSTNTTPYFGGDSYELTEHTITPDEFGGALTRAVVSGGDVVTSGDEIVWT